MLDFYKILGVDESASQAEIKLAFKAKAREYHPDKHKGNSQMEERFKEINLAYQTLKNPYEKARYDLKREFGQFTPPIYQEQTYQPPPAYTHTSKKINYRENWIATGYAFGFSLIIAILVMIGVEIKRNYDEERYAEVLEKRRSTFEKAVVEHSDGDMRQALQLMNSLGGFLSEEDDLEVFKDELVSEAYRLGNENYSAKNYSEAIYFYEIIDELTRIPPLSIKERLSISYKNTGQLDMSIKTLTDLLTLGYRNLFIYTELGRTYRDHYEDLYEAIRYLEQAQDLMVDYYESIYGRGYTITMSGKSVPEYHRQIYYELLELYTKTENRQQIIATAVWIKRLWPDNYESVITLAQAYEFCEQKEKSCKEYFEAASMNPQLVVPAFCDELTY